MSTAVEHGVVVPEPAVKAVEDRERRVLLKLLISVCPTQPRTGCSSLSSHIYVHRQSVGERFVTSRFTVVGWMSLSLSVKREC